MASHPSLGFLKKGLSTLKDSAKKCKDDLMARLKKAEKISDVDVAWLDDTANHVEEDAVIKKLENASDYEPDKEIFEAVQSMRKGQQDMEINGGDDNREDHSPEPKPTRKEALYVMATLRRYLEDEEGHFAHKLKVSLVMFGGLK
ncbi:hypothetical protein DFH09DRAFT_1319605 [Mycena vulgaris]|nr:hypothetical protein DFH09DRAFT_1319605 [Mycena vulgaris]